jgi:phosphatidylglycerophosphate synthase
MVQVRLLCNLFDGMVATASGPPSAVGELYNEVPDRVSDAATLVGFGYAAGGMPWLGYLAALSAVFTAYIRAMGKATGAGSDFRGPMAKQQRMFLVTAAAVYAALTPLDWQPCLGGEHGWRLPALVLAVVVVGTVWTSARRLRGIAMRLREQQQ